MEWKSFEIVSIVGLQMMHGHRIGFGAVFWYFARDVVFKQIIVYKNQMRTVAILWNDECG